MQDKRQGIASIPRETVLGGQPHMLAYINPKEERLLKGIGGLGIPGPGGVPPVSTEADVFEKIIEADGELYYMRRSTSIYPAPCGER